MSGPMLRRLRRDRRISQDELATEVQDCASCSNETKARLVREIIEYEESHGQCTKTFVRKVRKQIRPVT